MSGDCISSIGSFRYDGGQENWDVRKCNIGMCEQNRVLIDLLHKTSVIPPRLTLLYIED